MIDQPATYDFKVGTSNTTALERIVLNTVQTIIMAAKTKKNQNRTGEIISKRINTIAIGKSKTSGEADQTEMIKVSEKKMRGRTKNENILMIPEVISITKRNSNDRIYMNTSGTQINLKKYSITVLNGMSIIRAYWAGWLER